MCQNVALIVEDAIFLYEKTCCLVQSIKILASVYWLGEFCYAAYSNLLLVQCSVTMGYFGEGDLNIEFGHIALSGTS